MAQKLSDEQLVQLKSACEHLIDKVVKLSLELNAANTYEDGADKATRLTLAYFLKYGLLDIDNFIKLDDIIQTLTPEEIEYLNKSYIEETTKNL